MNNVYRLIKNTRNTHQFAAGACDGFVASAYSRVADSMQALAQSIDLATVSSNRFSRDQLRVMPFDLD